MITATPTKIEDAKELALRNWLEKGEFNLLKEVIAAKGKAELAKATQDAILAKEHPNYFSIANGHVIEAHKFATCIQVLDELANQKDPFQLVKLS